MGTITITVPSSGEAVTAASVANPLNSIKNEINGNLDNNNIKAGANIAWSKLSLTGSALGDIADITITTAAEGDILYRNNASKWINLSIGTAGQVLTVTSGVPAWGTAVPSGAIVMWSGTIANIPSGWVICDGNNSTPNLSDKFIIGVATAATNPADGGGSHTVTTGAPSDSSQLVAESPSPPTNGSPVSGHTHNLTATDVKHYRLAFIMKS